MENRKDIGKIFREKLNNFKKEPNDVVWDSIHAELQKKGKRKIIYIPFWMKTAGVFSLVAFISIFSIDAFLEKEQFSTPNKSNQEILNSKSIPKKDNTVNTKSLIQTDSSNVSISNRKNIHTSLNKTNWKNNKKKLNAKKSMIESKNNLVMSDYSNKKVFENNSLSAVENNNAKIETNNEKLDSLISSNEDKTELKIALEDKKDSLLDRKRGLYVFVYGSPTYSGILSSNSPLDNRLINNPKSTQMNWSYGVYLGYESDYKWSLRLGIGKMNMSFITENAIVNIADYNINYSKNTTNATIYTDTNFSETMTITQDISYTEIPLEIKYNFYDKKFGISSIVGFSYLFVDNNVISIKTANGNNFDIGSTKNLSESTFSINAGFEMYYKLSKKLKFNIEPLFKYHPIDYKKNSNPVNSYSFGIQGGLQFSFSK